MGLGFVLGRGTPRRLGSPQLGLAEIRAALRGAAAGKGLISSGRILRAGGARGVAKCPGLIHVFPPSALVNNSAASGPAPPGLSGSRCPQGGRAVGLLLLPCRLRRRAAAMALWHCCVSVGVAWGPGGTNRKDGLPKHSASPRASGSCSPLPHAVAGGVWGAWSSAGH